MEMDANGAGSTVTHPAPMEIDLRRRMAPRRAALERRMAQSRDRGSAAAAALLSARTLADQTVSHREKCNGLKDQLRKLEADLAQSLSIQTSKKSKYKLIDESISNTTTRNEHLRSLVMDQRARRDEYTNFISNQLEAIEALEANSSAKGKKNLDEAIIWYNKFLGFQVVGGEGVKFVFNKIDMQNLDKEYFFCIKLTKERYSLRQCVPFLEDYKELLKDLNCNNDLFKFVRIMRERFQAATINGRLPASSFCPDTSSITASSPGALSVDTRSENTTNQRHFQSRAKKQDIPTEKGLPSRSATSPHTMRRSPRILPLQEHR